MTDYVFKGTDAPAAAITYLLYELALPGNHKYQARLREELNSLSFPLDFKEISFLPFLNSLIYESLRLHPPGPGSFQQRWTTEQTAFTVHGKTYQLPSNTLVGTGAYSLHRSKDIFGQDAKHFRPERWEEKDEHRLQKMKEAWIPFGAGSRACLGQPYVSTRLVSSLLSLTLDLV
jgi:cytochrome P450